MLLLLLRKKWSSSYAGNSIHWNLFLRFAEISFLDSQFQDQESSIIDASLKSPRDHRPAHDPNSAAPTLKTRILCEMRVVAGTLDSDRLLLPSAHHLVPRLNMWLKQYVYLNGQQVWISQPASPLHLGSLMQTVQDPGHVPISHFLPEYGELTKIHGSIVEVEFSENRRRFDLTMKSVTGTPIMTLCTITNVRRSAINGRWVADVTGTTAEGKL